MKDDYNLCNCCVIVSRFKGQTATMQEQIVLEGTEYLLKFCKMQLDYSHLMQIYFFRLKYSFGSNTNNFSALKVVTTSKFCVIERKVTSVAH